MADPEKNINLDNIVCDDNNQQKSRGIVWAKTDPDLQLSFCQIFCISVAYLWLLVENSSSQIL